jgi:hypothetical protein
MFANPPAQQIARLLREARVIAIVGLSADRTRPSHGVARALQRFGYRIIPVTPSAASILGEPAVASLDQLPEVLAAEEHVDIVDVFRRPEHVAPIVTDCIRLSCRPCGCRRGWSTPWPPSARCRRGSSR